MRIQLDGRWVLSPREKQLKVWEKIRGWSLSECGNYLIPNFPPCTQRELIVTCLPCGKKSAAGYNCKLKHSLVGVDYCEQCAEKIDHAPQPVTIPLSESTTDILGTESEDS